MFDHGPWKDIIFQLKLLRSNLYCIRECIFVCVGMCVFDVRPRHLNLSILSEYSQTAFPGFLNSHPILIGISSIIFYASLLKARIYIYICTSCIPMAMQAYFWLLVLEMFLRTGRTLSSVRMKFGMKEGYTLLDINENKWGNSVFPYIYTLR